MKIPEDLSKLAPYRPGKPIEETKREFKIEQVFKLASNENPLGASPLAIEAISKKCSELNLYSDPTFYDLIRACEHKFEISNKNISFGNGSNEIIDLLIRIFVVGSSKQRVLISRYSFVAYQVCALAARVEPLFSSPQAKLKISLSAMSELLEKDQTAKQIKLIFLPNPNNPTGSVLPAVEVEEFLQRWKTRDDLLIVIDEAYHEYVRDHAYRSFLPDIEIYPNLAVLRTFSKIYGLAGLRVGALFARPEVIEVYNRVRTPFNVNELAQVAATAALSDEDHLEKTQKITWEGLDYCYRELKRLGLPYLESQGNFVLFETFRDASVLHQNLLKRGIILRPVENYGLPTCLRMSVGLMSENVPAIKALREACLETPMTTSKEAWL